MAKLSREEIFDQIELERIFQDDKWREGSSIWDSPISVKYVVLMEEIGEIAEAILNSDPKNLFEELIQSAAVLVAMLENLDPDAKVDWDNHGCG